MKNLSVGVSNLLWSNLGDRHFKIPAILESQNIRFIEMVPNISFSMNGALEVKLARSAKNYWESFGFKVVSFQSLLFGKPDLQIFGSSETQHKVLNHFNEIIECAAVIGANRLVLGSPKNRITPFGERKKAWDEGAKFFSKLQDLLKDTKIELAIEAAPHYYGGNFLTTTSEVVQFCDYLDCNNIKPHFDLACTILGNENPLDVWSNFSSKFRHIHISEPDLKPFTLASVVHQQFSKLINETKFEENTFAILEMLPPSEDIDDLEEATEKFSIIYGNQNE